MPANLLLLPLLAGYLFVHFCHHFRFRAQALDGYRLLLESATAGVLLAAASRFLIVCLKWNYPQVGNFWHRNLADGLPPYLGTATGAIVISVLVPFFENRFPSRKLVTAVYRTIILPRRMRIVRRFVIRTRRSHAANRSAALAVEITNHGNGFIRLLHFAATQDCLISVTMANRKWYVGYVADSVNLEPNEYFFRLLPVLSGYRDKDTLNISREVYYRPVYDEFVKSGRPIAAFVIILQLSQVQDARQFDEQIYNDHFVSRNAQSKKKGRGGESAVASWAAKTHLKKGRAAGKA